MTTPAQEPAGTPIFNTNGGVEKMSTDCDDASNTDGEQVHNPNCNTATVQGDANANGAAPDIDGRK